MAASRAVRKTTAPQNQQVDAPLEEVKVAPVTRREFLFYVWGASMALAAAASGGLIIWFALPRFEEGEFGGIIRWDGAVPQVGDPPTGNPVGKFWLSNTEEGLVAIYTVCTHLGCLYAWVQTAFRFECPCHGSKFTTTGKWIEGPAPRSLDRFPITVTAGGQTLTTDEEGNPIPGIDALSVTDLTVDTGERIQRDGRV